MARPDTSTAHYDTIVIGGGISGMVTANRAAELGQRTVVLEKGTADKYLCSTRYTGGTFHVCLTDLQVGPDKLSTAIETTTRGFARKDVAGAVAKDSLRLVRWLQAEGIKFVNLGHYHSFVLAPPSRTGPGLDWEGRGGDVLLRTLEANLKKRGSNILRGTRARALDVATPGMIKLDVEQAGVRSTLTAKAVVIADGGFPANVELVRQYITPVPEKILQRNALTATGDGLQMAMGVGAATLGMDCFYGHLLSRDAMNNNKLWPRPYVDSLATSGILVDANGRRFADEGEGGVYLANAVARLTDPLSASLIMDHAIWQGPGTSPLVPSNPHLPNAGGTLHRAHTLAELAALMGVPAQALQDTVAQYNQALESGALQQLTPTRRVDRHRPWPIKVAPFYAVPLCTGITNTMGGLMVDQDGAVLDKNGAAIPGLYAAGGASGGLEGGPSIGYVGGLIKATLGLRAAEKIANFSV
jgi:fumarate reductase flavoprotein subunit